MLEVIDDGLTGIRDLGVELLASDDPLDALHRWLTAYVEQAGVLRWAGPLLASPPAGESSTCRMARDSGGALVARAAKAGLVQRDIHIDDVLDMAAAIAWVGEQPHRDADPAIPSAAPGGQRAACRPRARAVTRGGGPGATSGQARAFSTICAAISAASSPAP